MSDADDGAGLADLFSADDDRRREEPAEPEAPKRKSRAGWFLRSVLLIGAASAITVAVIRSQGIKVPVLLVVGAFLALRLIMLAIAQVAPPPAAKRRARGGRGDTGDPAGPDSLRRAVRRWEFPLDESQRDADRFSSIVLPALTELADERLRLRHGITRASDPHRARELLGEPLWQVLNEPGRRTPKARDVSAYVDALERI
jgi:hypothetical protein